ncbi:hypothetical protein NHF40_10265 [Maricaulaceae bacterium EIL42A08]|nr:hypothetical protein [Maricaulaceae bacterium EIL42A08]
MKTLRFSMSTAIAACAVAVMGTTPGFAEASKAETSATVAAATQPLNSRTTVRWDLEGGGMSRDIVESDQAPGGAVLEVRVRRANDEAWRSRVTVPLIRDINAGDEVELRVWVRAERAIRGLDTGNLDLQIVRTSEPYDNIFSENIRPTEEGQYYTVRGIAEADFAADDVVFGANMAYGRQTIHFGPIFVDRVSSAADREGEG